MSTNRKSFFILLFLLIVSLSCITTFQTEQADYEATGRAATKRTMQAIKDQTETEAAQESSQDSSDDSKSPPSDTQLQGTQAPTSDPNGIDPSDILLPTGEFVFIPSYTPTSIPIPAILPPDSGKLVLLPSSTPTNIPEPFLSFSLISFNVYKTCSRFHTAQFHINNNSNVILKSAMVSCRNIDSSYFFGDWTNSPFHKNPNECPPGNGQLGPGVNTHVVVQPGNSFSERMLSGEVYECKLTLYDKNLPYDQRSEDLHMLTINGPQFIVP